MSQKDNIETLYIKTKNNIFEVNIKKTEYQDYITIGGTTFKKCMEIFITKTNGVPVKAKIQQIQSEPECGQAKLLERGDSVPMIKALLQFCKLRYPNIDNYSFDDESHIECSDESKNNRKPPRKQIKPLSLAFISIALQKKTWQERHQGAKMADSQLQKKQRDSVQKLDEIMNVSVEQFMIDNFLDEIQREIFLKYWKQGLTWNQFFNSIPKSQHCVFFYKWLPSLITRIIGGSYIPLNWYIDVSQISGELLEISNAYPQKNKNLTRKNKDRGFNFFNKNFGNSQIFTDDY